MRPRRSLIPVALAAGRLPLVYLVLYRRPATGIVPIPGGLVPKSPVPAVASTMSRAANAARVPLSKPRRKTSIPATPRRLRQKHRAPSVVFSNGMIHRCGNFTRADRDSEYIARPPCLADIKRLRLQNLQPPRHPHGRGAKCH